MVSYTETKALDELAQLNSRIWSDSCEISKSGALNSLGFSSGNCVVFEAFPDSGDTWLVRVMKDDGSLVEIDLDPNDMQFTKISNIDPNAYRSRRGQIMLKSCKTILRRKEGAL